MKRRFFETHLLAHAWHFATRLCYLVYTIAKALRFLKLGRLPGPVPLPRSAVPQRRVLRGARREPPARAVRPARGEARHRGKPALRRRAPGPGGRVAQERDFLLQRRDLRRVLVSTPIG